VPAALQHKGFISHTASIDNVISFFNFTVY